MNNMQKAFKTKSKLRCMADGGAVDPKTQLGVLGGPKDVGPGAGAKGTEPIFKSTVGGVPTFTDAFGKTAGAQAYTQNAAQPMGNFATNQNGRTVTPDAPVSQSALATRQTSPLADAGRSALGLAQQIPVFGPMVTAGKAMAGAAQNLPAPSALPMPAAAKLTPAAAPATDSSVHKSAAAPTAGLSPVLAASPLRAQSPYEKMTGQAAGSTTAAPTRPSWVQGPTPKPGAGMDYFGPNSSALNYTNAAPTPPVPAAPKIFPPYGMDANLFPAKPDEVAQLAAGGHVRGPGGPREDKIPAMLSDGEYVLPADTVEAVGKENLDALRAKTHKFTEGSKTNRMGLRKFFQGGDPFNASDLNDELDRTAPRKPPGKELMPYVEKPLVPTGRVASAAPAAVAAESAVPAAAKASLASKLAGGTNIALAGGLEALRTSEDWDSLNGAGEKTARVAEGIGRAAGSVAGAGIGATLGSAIPIAGTAVGGVLGGVAGFLAPDAANWAYNKLTGGDNRLASTIASDNRAQTIASEQLARDNAKRASVPPEAAKLSVAPQQAAGAGSALQGLNPLQQEALAGARSTLNQADNRSFGGRVNSNAREVNQRFDALAKQLSGMYSAKGQGNLARHLVELEQARAAALGQDTRTQADVLNNNTSATSALRGQRAQQQAAALSNLTGMGNTQAMGASNALAAQSRVDAAQIAAYQKAQAAQLKLEGKAEKDGFSRYNSMLDSMFATDEGIDTKARDKFNSFISATDPKYLQEAAGVESVKGLMSLPPQEQMNALQKLRKLAEINDVRNQTAASGSWPAPDYGTAVGLDAPVGTHNATWDDYWNRGLPASDYAWASLPFTDPNVVDMQSGQSVLRSKLQRGKNGGVDADRVKLMSDSINSIRRLRGE